MSDWQTKLAKWAISAITVPVKAWWSKRQAKKKAIKAERVKASEAIKTTKEYKRKRINDIRKAGGMAIVYDEEPTLG
jgi:hypothetical protein